MKKSLFNEPRIGDYTLCKECRRPISRYSGGIYCKVCQKKRAKRRKEEEKLQKKKEKLQRAEFKKNPPHKCLCQPELLINMGLTGSDPSIYGYRCKIDERTGTTVCSRCGGIPAKEHSHMIEIRLEEL
jgi:uncharacterized Zn finger protein (UPF0148 family)